MTDWGILNWLKHFKTELAVNIRKYPELVENIRKYRGLIPLITQQLKIHSHRMLN